MFRAPALSLAQARTDDDATSASSAAARILIVDDDEKLARLLGDYLRSQGYAVEAAHDGRSGTRLAMAGGWDLIVLDVMLPQVDGFSVLRALRVTSDVPVLMLTARGGEDDRIAGLEGGADDYLPKTASARELLARVRALLRRSTAAREPVAAALAVGALRVDGAARRAWLAGAELTLTPVEFDLLLALACRAGLACSREQLLARVRDRDFDGADRSIDVHIAALRRKLGDDPRAPRYLRTVRTVGYLLVDPAAP